MKNRIALTFIAIFSIYISCTTTQVIRDDVAYLYNPLYQQIEPEFTFTNQEESNTLAELVINPNKLLYTKDFSSNEYVARYKVVYQVFESLNNAPSIQTDTLEFSHIGVRGGKKLIRDKFIFNSPIGKDYYIQIQIADLNRNYNEEYIFLVEKKNNSSTNYFKLEGNSNHVKRNHTAHISHSNKDIDSLFVHCFERVYEPSAPPFSMYMELQFNHERDSSFVIKKDSSGKFPFTTSQQGFYILKTNENDENGLLLNTFTDNYPYLKSAYELLQPLKLLCSKQEFLNMVNEANTKLAVDNFWISGCGSKERAKVILELFYSRVEEANLYFTSIKEGWKTDRGMIYIIYGPPSKVYKSDGGENWLYGDNNTSISIDFTFRKVINPYSNNMYQLERNSIYRNSWYRMVDSWREGRIFTDNEK